MGGGRARVPRALRLCEALYAGGDAAPPAVAASPPSSLPLPCRAAPLEAVLSCCQAKKTECYFKRDVQKTIIRIKCIVLKSVSNQQHLPGMAARVHLLAQLDRVLQLLARLVLELGLCASNIGPMVWRRPAPAGRRSLPWSLVSTKPATLWDPWGGGSFVRPCAVPRPAARAARPARAAPPPSGASARSKCGEGRGRIAYLIPAPSMKLACTPAPPRRRGARRGGGSRCAAPPAAPTAARPNRPKAPLLGCDT
eukprot:gene422-biopygen10629